MKHLEFIISITIENILKTSFYHLFARTDSERNTQNKCICGSLQANIVFSNNLRMHFKALGTISAVFW